MILLKELLTIVLVFPAVLVVGGYFSIKLGFIQIRGLKSALQLLTIKEGDKSISSFSALAAILGGNLGTGNISGVAVALASGGPGAILWMWVMAILASVTKYAGCFLGVHFQSKNANHEPVGGPMYYLANGLGSKALAYLFCLFTVTSAFSVGNIVQVHSLQVSLPKNSIFSFAISACLTLLVALVLVGGTKRFAHAVSFLVPLMALFYLSACFLVLAVNYHQIIPAMSLIFTEAVSIKSASSGILGFGVMKSLTVGFDRGLFATDSGLGLAAIVHSSVKNPSNQSDNRHVQGLISLLSPMIVMVVCSITGLVLITTNAYQTSVLSSTAVCIEAFSTAMNPLLAHILVVVTLFFFAFTTILTWWFCAQKALNFCVKDKYLSFFQLLFIAFIPANYLFSDDLVWPLADLSINFMFLINILGLWGLRRLVVLKSPTVSKP